MSFQNAVGREAGALGSYRLYFLDSVDRLISGSFEFHATSDGAAIEIAQSMREDRPAELWSGARKVAELPGAAS